MLTYIWSRAFAALFAPRHDDIDDDRGQAVQRAEAEAARRRLLEATAAADGRWYDDPTRVYPVVTPGQRMLYRVPGQS